MTTPQPEQRSLFGEILDWMLTPLLLLWPVSLVLTWLVAQNIAGKPFDRALEYNVRALAQLVTVSDQRAQFQLPLPARELLRANDSDTIYYQVLGTRGEYLSGEHEMPLPPKEEVLEPGEVRIRDDVVHGDEVKVAYTWVKLPLPGARPALVQVAETLEKRSLLATEIVKGVMLPQFAILPMAVLLVWVALVQAIKPLHQLEERIRARKPDDLSPIEAQAVPLEVAPLVHSVNDLLLRLKDSIATQKRFLADAAHQLKTPLAGLRMQAELAQREDASAAELKQSLRQIGRASIRATHSVNQLLALARAESSGQAMPRQICDLAELTMAVVRDCVPRAIEKQIDLGYEGAQPGAPAGQLAANPTLIKELIRNLVDNALNYTPSSSSNPGVITARVLTDPFGKTLMLQVEDSGPGVPQAERELVFQPFYRALGTEADGTGLGLPIVMEIAHQHNATVSLEDAHPGHLPPGARFSVRFLASSFEAQPTT
ncbi:MAG: sensor histidine kinase N-terminal domain-containing protein [Gammaproteobacteria bacterium]|uniref:sensor histidine kinase n=1 Tax=Rhodoferax sp. TaxID=50421 RepID=UPI0018056392|nr:sensor histidine kinase [Rhodoferax sp.]MBU3898309.1 sensor histidine kinase N-terminal domain-containing protein [Gammaproteobacteria bacterium]MBA3058993.1 sensor histidine kinase [Rhodoferax sp.]MBU4081494.1 sensor histidine kinase N-terminal domain-containing protein [Gammaproteobacteria bacterium]MBU4114273.1 sensor histidine kinase N-terminal domain-containing protein [Gammaproteobacteria bacterium]MBU4170134.1 sensor histidine kinase N-terminal domain-containing protein [Gammaproteob